MSLKAILETWGPVMVTPAVIILLSLVEIAPVFQSDGVRVVF